MSSTSNNLNTPDGRYFVVRGRLWRLSNPKLDPAKRDLLVRELMTARRTIRTTTDMNAKVAARMRIDKAKRLLGERGEVWWDDGSPDYNRRFVKNTPYAEWYESARAARRL